MPPFLHGWYQNPDWRHQLCRPLATLYGFLSRLRRSYLQRKRPQLQAPVIVIGNISIGGTGKTPLTLAVCDWLQQQGWQPVILTRGYGGQSSHWPRQVSPSDAPQLCGDEAVLLAQRSHCPVLAGPDRLASIQLLPTHPKRIFVCDDGLQHYQLPRTVEIAVIDGQRRHGNGWLLPAGPLRELPSRLHEVSMRVCNGGKAEAGEYLMQLQTAEQACSLAGDTTRSLLSFRNEPYVHAIAGIGNPERFFRSLRTLGLRLKPHAFPDHHPYQETDLNFTDHAPVLMTEKDAVKCRSFAASNCWYCPVFATLPDAFYTHLHTHLSL